MSVEQRIKTILGEQLFSLVMMGVQLEDAHKRIAELEKEKAAGPVETNDKVEKLRK